MKDHMYKTPKIYTTSLALLCLIGVHQHLVAINHYVQTTRCTYMNSRSPCSATIETHVARNILRVCLEFD